MMTPKFPFYVSEKTMKNLEKVRHFTDLDEISNFVDSLSKSEKKEIDKFLMDAQKDMLQRTAKRFQQEQEDYAGANVTHLDKFFHIDDVSLTYGFRLIMNFAEKNYGKNAQIVFRLKFSRKNKNGFETLTPCTFTADTLQSDDKKLSDIFIESEKKVFYAMCHAKKLKVNENENNDEILKNFVLENYCKTVFEIFN